MFDVSQARLRRQFFLERASRRASRGAGSDLSRVLKTWVSKPEITMRFDALFGVTEVMLVGAHAASAYGPQRQTTDVDVLVPHEAYGDATALLNSIGFRKTGDLVFSGTKLGLYGSTWTNRDIGPDIDVIASEQPWTREAFDAPITRDRDGTRVIGLAWLVLMKLDASRSIDQGDLSRTLGRIPREDVERIASVVVRHDPDASIAADIAKYAEIGRWEYEEGHENRDPTT